MNKHNHHHLAALAALFLCLITPLLASAATSTAVSPLFTVDLTGQPPPDLIVENVRFTPASVSIGGVTTVSFRVRNLSGRTVAPLARVRLSSDTALTEADPAVSPLDVAIPSLAAGSAYEYSGGFTIIPGSLLPGNYYVVVRVDPLKELGQSNTGNDTAVSAAKLSVAGTGAPSLVVLPATRTATAEAGSTSFNINNGGGGSLLWTAPASSASWLHLASAAGSAPATLVATFDANPSISPRTGTINVSASGATPASVAVTVTQSGAPATVPVSAFSFSASFLLITANSPFSVTITALNSSGGIQTAFNEKVQLFAESGGNVSPHTIQLINGTWTGNVSLDTATTSTRLIAATTDGTRIQSLSSAFLVLPDLRLQRTITASIKVVDKAGSVIPGAIVSFGLSGSTPSQSVTDASGMAVFTVNDSGKYDLLVSKPGYRCETKSEAIGGLSIGRIITLRRPGLPVILVPGMLGSFEHYYWLSPVLPKGYPAERTSLKFTNPGGVVDWGYIQKSLEDAGFSVYRAAWDWRMPVSHNDENGKVAWKEYLLPVIAKAKAETGSSKVDIVAHSMGGLLTRAYINNAEYANDIDRFAMVGTPNDGSCKAYYLWYGGSSNKDSVYEKALARNHEEWLGDERDWGDFTDMERRAFIRTHIKSLEELLPVYQDAVSLNGVSIGIPDTTSNNGISIGIPNITSNPLYQLNQGSLDKLTSPFVTDDVRTKVFYSTSEQTIWQIKLNAVCSASGVWPQGLPAGKATKKGDATVVETSATMGSRNNPFLMKELPEGGGHALGLIKNSSKDVTEFLKENRIIPQATAMKSAIVTVALPTNQMLITMKGRSQPWITDPSGVGAGISPLSSIYSNDWSQSAVEISASSSSWLRDNPPAGTYVGTMIVFPGERIQLMAASSVGITNTVGDELQWIGTTNLISFNLQLSSSPGNPLALVTTVPAPTNLWSFASGGTCALTWDVVTNANVAKYKLYGRRKDEPLFVSLGTVTNPPFATGHPWLVTASLTNWYYTVVAVSTNDVESPYEKTVSNYEPTLARFTASTASGTMPLSVAFFDQSSGGITNWAWDFNSDGITDSTEQNPIASFALPGEYTVTLVVIGPNGTDTKVNVGQVTVNLPSLSAIRLLTSRSIELKLTGQAGRSYEIQVSSDLINWQSLTNVVASDSISTYVDLTAANQSVRFYRVVVP